MIGANPTFFLAGASPAFTSAVGTNANHRRPSTVQIQAPCSQPQFPLQIPTQTSIQPVKSLARPSQLTMGLTKPGQVEAHVDPVKEKIVEFVKIDKNLYSKSRKTFTRDAFCLDFDEGV